MVNREKERSFEISADFIISGSLSLSLSLSFFLSLSLFLSFSLSLSFFLSLSLSHSLFLSFFLSLSLSLTLSFSLSLFLSLSLSLSLSLIDTSSPPTGVGILHQPSYPSIPDLHSFQGLMVHTAHWDADVSKAIQGKRVGVIGTGASAVQLVPKIADDVSNLYVFQRTASWCPKRHNRRHSAILQWIFEHFPILMRLYRWSWFLYLEILFVALFGRKDNAFRRTMKSSVVTDMCDGIGSDPSLRESLIPKYDVFLKRITPSDHYLQVGSLSPLSLSSHSLTPSLSLSLLYPSYSLSHARTHAHTHTHTHTHTQSFSKKNVTLITDNIVKLTKKGIVVRESGREGKREGEGEREGEREREYELDVIVLATGFSPSQSVTHLPIFGKERKGLTDVLGDGEGVLSLFLSLSISLSLSSLLSLSLSLSSLRSSLSDCINVPARLMCLPHGDNIPNI